ncbi:MAG: ubiquinol-cytochrome C chaperone family protein [Henriciella sp.]
MLSRLFFPDRAKRARAASDLFHDLNQAARNPALFLKGRIPDTMDGRFHAIALHSAILLPELERRKPVGPKVSEAVYKRIFDGFDAALREEGVGDASIARKIRKMGEEFFGLGQSVQEALASADPSDSLAGVLRRNDICPQTGETVIARHLQTLDQYLKALNDDALIAGQARMASIHKSSVL